MKVKASVVLLQAHKRIISRTDGCAYACLTIERILQDIGDEHGVVATSDARLLLEQFRPTHITSPDLAWWYPGDPARPAALLQAVALAQQLEAAHGI